LPERSECDWEPLPDHLHAAAALAESFASVFGAAAWGRTLGLWHDLGKYSDAFQRRLSISSGEEHLEEQPNRVDHSTAGAHHARRVGVKFWRVLAYAIAGHHTGLGEATELDRRLNSAIEAWEAFADPTLLQIPDLGLPPLSLGHRDGRRFAFQAAFFTRMLFSCLIDADRLATEQFCNSEQAAERTIPPPLSELAKALRSHLREITAGARDTPVNCSRRAVLEACRASANHPPGFFSLSVPTGGGKTLASLAFACDHAERHSLRRVVVAIPFTSIIEQTADVYREALRALPDGAVIEHHSNLDPQSVSRRSYLAAENWDAPLVVTTNVQLFESLFASRTTPCRKLHRLAGSVIVLDEAQTLPPGLLRPCLAALRELVDDYGCTVVLCTATQPALNLRKEFPIGLEHVREIIPQPQVLAAAMRRVEVERLGRIGDDDLVERLSREPCWLTIVNTKPHATALYRRLHAHSNESGEGLFHLSTLMCGQHRGDRLTEIRTRLKQGLPTRVVSTQLIEAGVDVDFPVVFRAMAGVDSIAQAAGRCNREGKLSGLGKLWLFDPIDVTLRGDHGEMAAKTRELLPDFPDPLDAAAVERYFQLYYWSRRGDHSWDDPDVLSCFPEERGQFAYDFRTAAERFRMIEESTESVFVPYGPGAQLVDLLRRRGPERFLLRRLQRYVVGVFPLAHAALVAAGDIETENGFSVLANTDIYDNNLGLLVDQPGQRRPENLVI
jgi:CRISPR-associated endonuclease/helicase Cas3